MSPRRARTRRLALALTSAVYLAACAAVLILAVSRQEHRYGMASTGNWTDVSFLPFNLVCLALALLPITALAGWTWVRRDTPWVLPVLGAVAGVLVAAGSSFSVIFRLGGVSDPVAREDVGSAVASCVVLSVVAVVECAASRVLFSTGPADVADQRPES